jgi:hypothetical protein
MTNPSDIDYSSNFEKEHPHMTITEIEPLGYGNPDAHISITERLKDPLQREMIDRVGEIINLGELFVAVDKDDDGCIDGRIASFVSFINAELHDIETKPIEDQGHERAKVAGGGYVTALAMYIAAKFNNGSVEGDLKAVTALLTEQGVYCGAHTAGSPHPVGEATGCGANDQLDEILKTAVKYAAEIRGHAEALIGIAGLKVSDDVIRDVNDRWDKAANDPAYFEGSNGNTRFADIKDAMVDAQVHSGSENPVAVSKNLDGSHQEAYIVVNFKQGYTLSQRTLQETLVKEYPDVNPLELPQAFVVDAWRVVKLATALVEADSTIDLEAALYAGVAFQLATAARLTDGTLRVRIAQ